MVIRSSSGQPASPSPPPARPVLSPGTSANAIPPPGEPTPATAAEGAPVALEDPGPYGPVGRSAWMDVDWGAHRRTVEVGGRAVNVVDLGAGEPTVVFVHGLSGSWRNWLENLPHFARRHRAIAFDLPGFGASEMPAERISIPGYAQAVDDLLGRLGVGPVAVVGNSMGGFIAAELAILFPARVERLVLVAAAGLTVESLRNERALALLRQGRNVLARYGSFLESRAEALARRAAGRRFLFGFVAHRPDLLPPALVAAQMHGSGKPGLVDAIDALTDHPIRDRLCNVACPTLIVWGERDRFVPVRDAHEFERLIADTRKVIWPQTGHNPMLERPLAFNALVDAFLAERPREEVNGRVAANAPDAPPGAGG